ncbi:conserved hypothetical protein [Leishmania infantum JPCM5]|uniref:Uncharacterized protein n=2 Tax=Leishmania donovani species complex TaxID=38574 RepID=A4I1Z9_LEIIN|nr:conserved hypothetical protein [Leishmania infantum JPCM5]XP_003861652.1 hypothetical protein, conserved [Leishmania donovani]AYU79666.1 Thioredoxin, putative [Leishmania donovani]CAM68784.1 conserved hypothetical protein [Leishmania infantum JPCM5]CBZ34953.1 hypothetical protein, conserved [Leishmania donovani]|eukprot:XP_001470410.1 conserved hypothetical protein [Leishmania infantum JPCM5]
MQQRLVVGKVNAPNEARIQRRYKVSGYPTVIMVPPNKHAGVEFTGNRNFNQLLDFVERERWRRRSTLLRNRLRGRGDREGWRGRARGGLRGQGDLAERGRGMRVWRAVRVKVDG